jgi:hypothetical protein
MYGLSGMQQEKTSFDTVGFYWEEFAYYDEFFQFSFS